MRMDAKTNGAKRAKRNQKKTWADRLKSRQPALSDKEKREIADALVEYLSDPANRNRKKR